MAHGGLPGRRRAPSPMTACPRARHETGNELITQNREERPAPATGERRRQASGRPRVVAGLAGGERSGGVHVSATPGCATASSGHARAPISLRRGRRAAAGRRRPADVRPGPEGDRLDVLMRGDCRAKRCRAPARATVEALRRGRSFSRRLNHRHPARTPPRRSRGATRARRSEMTRSGVGGGSSVDRPSPSLPVPRLQLIATSKPLGSGQACPLASA